MPEAAVLVGVSPHTWSAYEAGRRFPSVPRLELIAAVLQAPQLGEIVCGPTDAARRLRMLAETVSRARAMVADTLRTVGELT